MNVCCEVSWIYNQAANDSVFFSIVLCLFIFSMPKISINFTFFLSNLRDLILHDHFGNEVVKQNSEAIYNSSPAHEFF